MLVNKLDVTDGTTVDWTMMEHVIDFVDHLDFLVEHHNVVVQCGKCVTLVHTLNKSNCVEKLLVRSLFSFMLFINSWLNRVLQLCSCSCNRKSPAVLFLNTWPSMVKSHLWLVPTWRWRRHTRLHLKMEAFSSMGGGKSWGRTHRWQLDTWCSSCSTMGLQGISSLLATFLLLMKCSSPGARLMLCMVLLSTVVLLWSIVMNWCPFVLCGARHGGMLI